MTLGDQLSKIRENWLLIVIVLIVVGFLNFGGIGNLGSLNSYSQNAMFEKSSAQDMAYSRTGGAIMPPSYGDFAPEVAQRKITKSATMTNEVETGTFKEAESKLKSIITSTNSYLLNENANKYESGRKSY